MAAKKTTKSKTVKKADLKKVSGGAMSKVKVSGWTNPQKAGSAGAVRQDDTALSGAAGGMSKVKVSGWTNAQKARAAGAQQQDDTALSGAAGGMSKAKVAGWTNPQKAKSGGAVQQTDDALGGAVGGTSSVSASKSGKAGVDGSKRMRLDGADLEIN